MHLGGCQTIYHFNKAEDVLGPFVAFLFTTLSSPWAKFSLSKSFVRHFNAAQLGTFKKETCCCHITRLHEAVSLTYLKKPALLFIFSFTLMPAVHVVGTLQVKMDSCDVDTKFALEGEQHLQPLSESSGDSVDWVSAVSSRLYRWRVSVQHSLCCSKKRGLEYISLTQERAGKLKKPQLLQCQLCTLTCHLTLQCTAWNT